MKRLIIIALGLSCICSCCRVDLDEVLLPREEVSLTLKGEPQFSYDPVTCQMSHKDRTNEYRVYDDRLSKWMIVKCTERPVTKGQTLHADVTWTASTATRVERNLKFTVEKTSPDGRIWMWNKSQSIGLVIKNL
jgi:hypothetical protein